jgi:cell division protein FtsB
MAASAALVAVGIYGIFPVRTFLNQRQTESDTRERLDHLAEANRRLAEEARRLKDKDEIELRARRDYGWVFPGEESYRVLPAPTPRTSTTTTPNDAKGNDGNSNDSDG